MKVLIDQIEVNKELFVVNDGLNYGRFFDKNTITYEIQFNTTEIIELIEKEYCIVRDEIKTDDIKYNDTSDFKKTNYCSFSQLLNHESDFEEIMKTYLLITLFQKVFTESSKKAYVINSTDSIKIKNDMIIFKGRVIELNN